MRRILVLRGGALGDLIVTLPALQSLRQHWPASRIELVGNVTAAALAHAAGLIDTAHSQHEARWAALYGAAPLPGPFQAWLAEFDLVLSYWPDPAHDLVARFPQRQGQIFLSANAMPRQAPAAAHYCTPLIALGVSVASIWCDLDQLLPKPEAVDVKTLNRNARLPPNFPTSPAPQENTRSCRAKIAIHPGSGSPRKNWSLEHWAEICRWQQNDCDAQLLIISGEAENSHVLAQFGQTARNLPLLELANRLRECQLFLGHDSGVSHLAAAMNVPCVLLFGPTDPATWAPPAPRVRVLQRGSELSAILPNEVKLAVTAVLEDRT